MADRAAHASYDVVCPHCKKRFEGQLMGAAAPPWTSGFKCPHCRLFVPFERANGEPLADGSD